LKEFSYSLIETVTSWNPTLCKKRKGWATRLNVAKTKPPAPGQVLRGSWRFKSSTALLVLTLLRLTLLRLNDSRRNEENQFLIRSAHLRVLEQVAEVRDVAGLPCTSWPKFGVVFSTSMFRKIVLSEVICGVTVKRRKAST